MSFSFFNPNPSLPRTAPAPAPGLGVNINLAGGLPTGINGIGTYAINPSTTAYVMAGTSLPVAHPSAPTSSPLESQISGGVTFRLGK